MADSVALHYASGYEGERLDSPMGQVEFLRTIGLLHERLPKPPASVLDVGGATGRYSLHLARAGYQTHLVDIVPLHVEAAQRASDGVEEPKLRLCTAQVGDARALPASLCATSMDAVLLMGPMYHLPHKEDRAKALKEAARVLRPGGLLVCAAISRYASVMDGLRCGYLRDPVFQAIVKRDLETGEHVNPTGNVEYFTHAAFLSPEQLQQELAAAGFEQPNVVGVEGPSWMLDDTRLNEWLADEAGRKILLDSLRSIQSESALIGASSHLLAFAHKSKSTS